MNTKISEKHPKEIYQDQDILVIDKPAGLLSIPDGYDLQLPHLRGLLESKYGKLWMVHRLDKETSGLLVLARHADSHQKLNEIFRDRKVKKVYHCLVHPLPEWRTLDINLPLLTNADRAHRTRVNSSGKPARSICSVIKRFRTSALIEVDLFSGITHQIRAHLRQFDIALLGDELYRVGLQPPPIEVPRMMLHARRLTFNHPRTGKHLEFRANYPEDFRQIYMKLRLSTDQDGGS